MRFAQSVKETVWRQIDATTKPRMYTAIRLSNEWPLPVPALRGTENGGNHQ